MVESDVLKSWARVLIATLTTVTSRIDMIAPRTTHSATSIRPRSSAWGWPLAGGGACVDSAGSTGGRAAGAPNSGVGSELEPLLGRDSVVDIASPGTVS